MILRECVDWDPTSILLTVAPLILLLFIFVMVPLITIGVIALIQNNKKKNVNTQLTQEKIDPSKPLGEVPVQDDEAWTNAELEEIQEFKKYLLSKRQS